MATVNVELSEYDSLRDSLKEYKERAAELEKHNKSLLNKLFNW